VESGENSKLLSIEQYLSLSQDERLKLLIDKQFGIDWDPEQDEIPSIKFPCHFPDLAMSSCCPFLQNGAVCTEVKEWINCEEVLLKKKLEISQASKEFETRKKDLQDQGSPPPQSDAR